MVKVVLHDEQISKAQNAQISTLPPLGTVVETKPDDDAALRLINPSVKLEDFYEKNLQARSKITESGKRLFDAYFSLEEAIQGVKSNEYSDSVLKQLAAKLLDAPKLQNEQEKAAFQQKYPEIFEIINQDKLTVEHSRGLLRCLQAASKALDITDFSVEIAAPTKFAELKKLSLSEGQDTILYKTIALDILRKYTVDTNELPLNSEGLELFNRKRIEQLVAAVTNNPQATEEVLKSIGKAELRSNYLSFQLRGGELTISKRDSQGAEIELHRIAGRDPNLPIRVEINKDAAVDHKIQSNVTDWMYDRPKQIYVQALNESTLNNVINIIDAFPSVVFHVGYNPEYWRDKYGVTDFSAWFDKEKERLGIKAKTITFADNVTYSEDNLGYPWVRDHFFQGITSDGSNIVYRTREEVRIWEDGKSNENPERLRYSDQINAKEIFTDIPIEGGAQYTAGKNFFSGKVIYNNFESANPCVKGHAEVRTPTGESLKVNFRFPIENEIDKNRHSTKEKLAHAKAQAATYVAGYFEKNGYFKGLTEDQKTTFSKDLESQFINGTITVSMQFGYEVGDRIISNQNEARKALSQMIETTFNRKLLVMGEGLKTDNPENHIDTYAIFTPGKSDKPTIFINDPSLWSNIMGKLSTDELEAVKRSMIAQVYASKRLSFSERPFVDGYPKFDQLTSILLKNPKMLTVPEGQSSYQKNADQEANSLRKQGFNVVRLPVFVTDEANLASKYFNYANVIPVGFVDGVYTIKMNRYGIKPVEDYIVKTMAQQGVNIEWMNGNHTASGTAGPHCLTNQIK